MQALQELGSVADRNNDSLKVQVASLLALLVRLVSDPCPGTVACVLLLKLSLLSMQHLSLTALQTLCCGDAQSLLLKVQCTQQSSR